MIRGAYGDISSGRVDGLGHHVEDRAAGRRGPGCSARPSTDGRDAVELGVELQRGDELLGAGDLEVHVAERVLGAEDVGQRDVLGLAVDRVGDEAHRDARDRRLAAARRRGAATASRRRPSPSRSSRWSRAPRRPAGSRTGTPRGSAAPAERPLGERAVADLAALGRADPAGLAGGERREDVVVHVALRVLRGERVELLLHPEHVQRGDAQDLGLAALEQRRAVHPRDHADLGVTAGGCRPGRGRRCGPCRAARARGRASCSASGTPRRSPSRDPRTGRRAARRPAALISSSSASRSCLPAMVSAAARSALDGGLDGGVHVVLVVEEERELPTAWPRLRPARPAPRRAA